MKLGIIGLPKTGKTTLFNALTGMSAKTSHFSGPSQQVNVGVAKLADPRLDFIFHLESPKKMVPLAVEYVDVGGISGPHDRGTELSESFLNAIRPADGLIMVLRNFDDPSLGRLDPLAEAAHVRAELILSDLQVVEKKLARMDKERHKGKKFQPMEKELLEKAKETLELSMPLRGMAEDFDTPAMRGYGFLSLKPLLFVINQPDEDPTPVDTSSLAGERTDAVEIRARLEMELMELEEDEAIMFRDEYGLRASVLDLVVERSFRLLDLVTFYTVNEQEAHAWTVAKGTPAVKAAGAVHSDFEKGFIRAEVVAYHDLSDAGSFKDAKDRGVYRLEGKEYQVQDGDIIQFRFKV